MNTSYANFFNEIKVLEKNIVLSTFGFKMKKSKLIRKIVKNNKMILTWKVKDIKGIWTFNKEPYNRKTPGKSSEDYTGKLRT